MNQKDLGFHSDASQEPNDSDIVRFLLKLREQYRHDQRELEGQMNALLKKMDAVEYLIVCETAGDGADFAAAELSPDEVVEAPPGDLAESDSTTDDAGPVSGFATAKHISHCRTQREAAYVIAEVNGGPIDLNSAAVVIREVPGLSSGMLSTVVSSLHHFMTHSEDWNHTGPSQFELLACRESAPEAGSEAESGDEESPESAVAEFDLTAPRTYEETAA